MIEVAIFNSRIAARQPRHARSLEAAARERWQLVKWEVKYEAVRVLEAAGRSTPRCAHEWSLESARCLRYDGAAPKPTARVHGQGHRGIVGV
jgi:hypothetical protein